jgi:hypothetical protein
MMTMRVYWPQCTNSQHESCKHNRQLENLIRKCTTIQDNTLHSKYQTDIKA